MDKLLGGGGYLCFLGGKPHYFSEFQISCFLLPSAIVIIGPWYDLEGETLLTSLRVPMYVQYVHCTLDIMSTYLHNLLYLPLIHIYTSCPSFVLYFLLQVCMCVRDSSFNTDGRMLSEMFGMRKTISKSTKFR